MKKMQAARPTRAKPKASPPRDGTPNRRSKPAPAAAPWDDLRAYKILARYGGDIFSLIDASGKNLYRSPSARQIDCLSDEEIDRSSFLEWVWPDDRPMVREKLGEIIRSPGVSVSFRTRIRTADGLPAWIEGIGANHLADPDVGAILVHYRDITEPMNRQSALEENERRFQELFEHATVAIFQSSPDGKLIRVNPEFARLFGYESPAAVVRSVRHTGQLYSDPARREEILRRLQSEPGQRTFENLYRRKDGAAFWGLLNVRSVQDAAGRPLYLEGFVADITSIRRAENALRENEERYRSLFENSLEGIGLSQGNRIVDANRALLDMFGYESLEEFRAVPLLDHIAPESSEDIRRRMEESALSGKSRFRYKIVRKDGGLRDLEVSADHVTIGGERFTLGTFRDITECKRAEEELAALARRHATLLSAIPEIVMEVDDRKVYTWANPAGIEFFGEDVIGREAADYFVGEQSIYEAVRPLFAGGEETIYVESWQRRRDGQQRLLAWWCRNLKNSRGEVTGALSSARDITERREAEEEIQGLSRFPTENPSPVMRVTPEGRLLFANAASRPFLAKWRIGVGEMLPQECRALVGEAYLSNALREIQMSVGDKVFTCTLAPIQPGGYLNLYSQDITETKRAQDALAQQAEELRQSNADLARLNDLTERRLQRLTALRTIDTAITSSFKLELVLNILLGQLADLIGAHAADILIYLPDLQTFRFSCGRGFHATGAQQIYLRKTGSYANQAAQDRRTVKVPLLDEAADAARIYPRIAGEGFRSYLCLPLVAKGMIKGVLELFQRGPIDLDPEEENFLEMIAGQAAIAIDNDELFEGLQSTNDELILAYNDTLTGWARTLELRHGETGGETQRLADEAIRLARALGSGEADLVSIYRGAVLHDIGMMGVPDSILLKPGPLSDAEWEVVRRHPQYAHDLLTSINYLRSAIDIPFCHHEKWDGSGYPRGLAGDQIPFAARVFAVVDVWDAMRSSRPYRRPHTDAHAREEIGRLSGTQFDPEVVKAFLELPSS
jgi:PAS domain S-box-containing protein